jgi:hypothetical protein
VSAPSSGQLIRARLTAEQEAALTEKLKDRWWRLTSGEIYKIAPADGSGIVPFIPSEDQMKIFRALLGGCKKLMLPKCRRPGFSTALGIFALDMMLFIGGVQISLVDQNQPDASRKLDRIIGIALDNLPGFILRRTKITPRGERSPNLKLLSVQFAHKKKSTFYAGMNARGGSNDLLWVSEWGVIQFEDARRSAKIRSGGLPSARHGIAVIETTWAGGRRGDVWELLDPVLKKESDDWEIQFSPWQNDPRNVDDHAKMDDVAYRYFTSIEEQASAMGITFTDAQKRWWAKEKREQGIFMNRENPTFLDEMWKSPVKGSVYAEAIDRARSEGRIAKMPVAEHTLVHTFWDLGAPEQTVVWYAQVVGRYFRIIDVDTGVNETITQKVARMKASGYAFGNHFMPHDAMQTSRGGLTLAAEFSGAWLKLEHSTWGQLGLDDFIKRSNVRFTKRTHNVWVGINHLLQIFSSLEFAASEKMETALADLSLYRTILDGPNAGEIYHDIYSHAADALRTLAEAHLGGLLAWKQVGNQTSDWSYPREEKRKRVKEINVGG